MNLADGSREQLTNEPYRFVSSGMWHPDGDRVVAVKWYTSTRSVPAGEIWEFRVDTGEARSLVGRPAPASETTTANFGVQIGPEEPVYSPGTKKIN